MHERHNNQVEKPHGRSYHVSQYRNISLTDCFLQLDEPYFVDGSGMNIILHRVCTHGWIEFAMSTVRFKRK
jgi:hypothetical protein